MLKDCVGVSDHQPQRAFQSLKESPLMAGETKRAIERRVTSLSKYFFVVFLPDCYSEGSQCPDDFTGVDSPVEQLMKSIQRAFRSVRADPRLFSSLV